MGGISTENLIPNTEEPIDKDSLKLVLDLAKNYIANSATSLKQDLTLELNDDDLQTALDTLIAANSADIGEDEQKNLEKLLKEALKTAEASIDSCVQFWEKIGEIYFIIVKGVWTDCSKTANCAEVVTLN